MLYSDKHQNYTQSDFKKRLQSYEVRIKIPRNCANVEVGFGTHLGNPDVVVQFPSLQTKICRRKQIFTSDG